MDVHLSKQDQNPLPPFLPFTPLDQSTVFRHPKLYPGRVTLKVKVFSTDVSALRTPSPDNHPLPDSKRVHTPFSVLGVLGLHLS